MINEIKFLKTLLLLLLLLLLSFLFTYGNTILQQIEIFAALIGAGIALLGASIGYIYKSSQEKKRFSVLLFYDLYSLNEYVENLMSLGDLTNRDISSLPNIRYNENWQEYVCNSNLNKYPLLIKHVFKIYDSVYNFNQIHNNLTGFWFQNQNSRKKGECLENISLEAARLKNLFFQSTNSDCFTKEYKAIMTILYDDPDNEFKAAN